MGKAFRTSLYPEPDEQREEELPYPPPPVSADDPAVQSAVRLAFGTQDGADDYRRPQFRDIQPPKFEEFERHKPATIKCALKQFVTGMIPGYEEMKERDIQ